MTETDQDAQELLAAEYVLGTLDPEERVRARALAEMDPGFAAAVRAWERRLGELNVLVAAIEPPSELWEGIRAAIGMPGGQRAARAAVEPEQPPLPELRAPAPVVPPQAPREQPAETTDAARLQRRARRWRKVALWLFLVAAAGAGLGVLREMYPEYLPPELRPKTRTIEVAKTLEVASPKPAQYVAVLQKEGVEPAFLVTFDLERRTLIVRNVGAPVQIGKSYQLWLVSSKFSSPRSLGVIGTEEYSRPQLAAYDAVILNSATYAVSLEPQGGSPTGIPTGPMLYSGRLIQVTPIGFRDQTP